MQVLKDLLNGKYIDAVGNVVSVPIELVLCEEGVLKNIKDIILSLDIGKKFLLVCDDNTYEVAGRHIEKAFDYNDNNDLNILVLPEDVIPSDKYVEAISSEDNGLYDAYIAVGSGTINDLCKYASFKNGKKYIVVPTAPSMNGYCSANASIIVGEYRASLPAHLPYAILADLNVLCEAPARLIKSGFGDSICRATCQVDWLLSHYLLGTKYFALPFELAIQYEDILFSICDRLEKGDKDAIKMLMELLLVSGLGMYISGGSYPASQSEHMVAHTMHMLYGKRLSKTYHGEEIGVTACTIAALQEKTIFSDDFPKIGIDRGYKEKIKKSTRADLQELFISEYEKKISYIDVNGMAEFLEKNWFDIRKKLAKVYMPSNIIEEILKKSNCGFLPSHIGWDKKKYQNALDFAKFSRNRFTILDFDM